MGLSDTGIHRDSDDTYAQRPDGGSLCCSGLSADAEKGISQKHIVGAVEGGRSIYPHKSLVFSALSGVYV